MPNFLEGFNHTVNLYATWLYINIKSVWLKNCVILLGKNKNNIRLCFSVITIITMETFLCIWATP